MSLIVSNAYAINTKPQPINYQEENYYTKPMYIQEGYISLKAWKDDIQDCRNETLEYISYFSSLGKWVPEEEKAKLNVYLNNMEKTNSVFQYNQEKEEVKKILENAYQESLKPSPRELIVCAAESYLGTPYVWGGCSDNGMDCSGLVKLCYSTVGIELPHYTGSQFNCGEVVNEPQPGDLLFFGYDKHHVAIYVGDGQFIHAPQTGDVVKITNVSSYSYTYAVSIL